MEFNDTPPRCPLCGSHVLKLYGCGWDYDRWICGRRMCDIAAKRQERIAELDALGD